jgi:hypothetical protein
MGRVHHGPNVPVVQRTASSRPRSRHFEQNADVLLKDGIAETAARYMTCTNGGSADSRPQDRIKAHRRRIRGQAARAQRPCSSKRHAPARLVGHGDRPDAKTLEDPRTAATPTTAARNPGRGNIGAGGSLDTTSSPDNRGVPSPRPFGNGRRRRSSARVTPYRVALPEQQPGRPFHPRRGPCVWGVGCSGHRSSEPSIDNPRDP